jgi:sulfide dehydrogenase cytochrome subunit
MGYLETAFKAYTSGERPMPKKMKAKMDLVDKEGIEALINYYGSFK